MLHATQDQIARLKDILTRLDNPNATGDKENRRRLPRVAMRIPMAISLLSGTTTSTVEIFTRNISGSGMGFVSRRLFRSEERIAVSFRIPKLPQKMVLARVTFGRYLQGGLYEMGAEFLEAITDSRGNGHIPSQWVHSAHQLRMAATNPASN